MRCQRRTVVGRRLDAPQVNAQYHRTSHPYIAEYPSLAFRLLRRSRTTSYPTVS